MFMPTFFFALYCICLYFIVITCFSILSLPTRFLKTVNLSKLRSTWQMPGNQLKRKLTFIECLTAVQFAYTLT